MIDSELMHFCIYTDHRVYKSFKDADQLYILTEASLGGDLSSLLKDKWVPETPEWMKLQQNSNLSHSLSLCWENIYVMFLLCSQLIAHPNKM